MTAESTLAVLCPAPGAVEVRTVQRADLGPHDVLVRTRYSGVSTGTDRWTITDRFGWEPMRYPLVPGYQRSGRVEAVGTAVTAFHRGQRVAATSSTGLQDVHGWGGHVALAAADESEVLDAEGVDPRAAALVVVAQVGLNAASRVMAPLGARVAVIGDGVVGAAGALAATARGFDVLVVGRHEERLEPLGRLGPRTADARTTAAAALAEWRPQAVIDTVQSDLSFASYVEVLPIRTGQIVFSGHATDGQQGWGSMTRMQQRELTASFVSGWTRERLEQTLRLMRIGRLPLERLVGHVAHGPDAIRETMRDVVAGRVRPTAALLDWAG